jgi:hypothetical protein
MLQRFVRGAAGGEGAELGEVFGGYGIVAVGEDEGAVALKDVREKNFGIARGDVGGGFGDGFLESHQVQTVDSKQ